MRINPISQNNQSFKAVNQKYYKQAQEWLNACGAIPNDVYCRLRYNIFAEKIPIQDGIDTLNAIKKLLKTFDSTLERDLGNYQNLLKR